MTEVNKAEAVREAHEKSLKAEIRTKVEQIDTLKLSILKHEYELYALYSKLNELDSETKPMHTQNGIVKLYSSEQNRMAADRIRQSEEIIGTPHDEPVIA